MSQARPLFTGNAFEFESKPWGSSSFFVALCSSSIFSDSGLRHFEALALPFCSMDTFCVCQ